MPENILLFIEFRISAAFLFLFVVLFILRRYKLPVTIGICVASYAVIGAMDYGLFIVQGMPSPAISYTLAEVVVVQGTVFLIARYRDFRALFVGFCSATFVLPGNILDTAVKLSTGLAWASVVVEVAVDSVLIVFFSLTMRQDFLAEQENASRRWGMLSLLPALLYAVVESMFQLTSDTLTVVIPSLLMLFLMGAVYWIVLRLFAELHRDQELVRDNELLTAYADSIKRTSLALQDAEAEAAIIRHDARHHSALIRSYLDNHDYDKIREMVDAYDRHLDEETPDRYCQNMALNDVISEYSKKAKRENITFICEADIPDKLSVNEYEYATVLLNFLENAFRAASGVKDPKRRYVKLTVHRMKDKKITEVSNPFEGERQFSDVTGLPVSMGGKGHGIGLRSVQAFAKRNDAVFDYSVEDGIFYARILFDAKYDEDGNIIENPSTRVNKATR